MATYYIRKTGDNANNGTSPATAWATIGKALASGSTVVAGDVVYVGAGVYHEAVTVAVSGSSGNPITLIADVDGGQTGDAGPVIWSNWIGASGFDAPHTGAACALTLNGSDDVTLTGFTFIGGGSTTSLGDLLTGSGSSLRWTFNDCLWIAAKTAASNGQMLRVNGDSTVNGGTMSWRFNRCGFYGGNQSFTFVNVSSSTGNGNADWDYDIEFHDCLLLAAQLTVEASGGLTYKGGGFDFYRCTSLMGAFIIIPGASAGGLSATVQSIIKNCVHWSHTGGTAMQAPAAGGITEDYNLLYSSTPRVNVSAGANSSSTASALHIPSIGLPISLLLDRIHAQVLGEPLAWPGMFVSKDMWRIGHDAGVTSSTDMRGLPRPSGGQSTNKASGAFELPNVGVVATDQFDVTPALKITGPGVHDVYLVLPAGSATISVKARYDANHGATNKPQVSIMANGELGVSAQTVTMTAAADTWETLTFSAISPTSKGVVRLRLESRAGLGTGNAWFDTISVT